MKTIVLMTGSESTRKELEAQLEAVLGSVASIESYAVDSGIRGRVRGDLVVLSTELIREEALPYFDPECPMLVARRTLDMTRIDGLFSIPAGARAVLVNDTRETAEETAELIRSLGIDHFSLVPYHPGIPFPEGVEVAVTPGEKDLVPVPMKLCVDIGSRVIDMTTIVEILERLDLLDSRANLVSARYLETVVRLHRQLYDALREKGRYNDYLTQVLDSVNEGMLVCDLNGRVTLMNQQCEVIFGISAKRAAGRSVHQLLGPEGGAFLTDFSEGPVRALTLGKREYVLNRFLVENREAIVCTLRDSAETDRMREALRRDLIRKGHVAKYRFQDILGTSPVMQETIENARKLAVTDLNVLIEGETGTGKELFASAIHNASARAEGPFLAVNFSALPEELVESELFGYVEGAFTGARKGGKPGLFEQADGGTLFLDEIGDISTKIQARLLRVLQEKEIMRVGGGEIQTVDVRVIAATHRDLRQLCREGRFREDLYYRLKRLYMKTPALRHRPGDIPLLVEGFLRRQRRERLALTPQVLEALEAWLWPGNVRELESVIEYMGAVCDGEWADMGHLPPDLRNREPEVLLHAPIPPTEVAALDAEGLLLEWIRDLRRAGFRVGRRTLAAKARTAGVPLTENRIRQLLESLRTSGRVEIHAGRRGIELAEVKTGE